jgi:O-antigen ligase
MTTGGAVLRAVPGTTSPVRCTGVRQRLQAHRRVLEFRFALSALIACSFGASIVAGGRFGILAPLLSVGTVGMASIFVAQSTVARKGIGDAGRSFLLVYGLLAVHELLFATDFSPVSFAGYVLVGYAAYAVLPPMLLASDRWVEHLLGLIVRLSLVLAVTVLVGGVGYDHLFGIPLRVKESYAQFSGFAASGGVFQHPAAAGITLATALVAAAHLRRRQRTIWMLPAMWVLGAALIVTQARGAFLGLVLALVVGRLDSRRLPNWAFPVLIAAGVLVATFGYRILEVVPPLADFLRIERGTSGRTFVWELAVDRLTDSPWLGFGGGSAQQFTADNIEVLRAGSFRAAGASLHNAYLTSAFEYGVPLGLLYAWLMLSPLAAVTDVVTRRPDDVLARTLRAMAVVVCVAAAFTDVNIGGVRATSLLGALVLGLCRSMGERRLDHG